MKTQACGFTHWLFVLLFLIGLAGPALAVTDFFSTGPGAGAPDGICDVWQSIYNGWGLDSDGDADKDGCSNYDECAAGTDPRQAGDCLRVGNGAGSAGKIVFTFKAKAGKIYRVLSDASAGGAFSTVVTQLAPVNGQPEFLAAADNANQAITVAKTAGKQKIYKLEVADADSDSDGVSDWAEIQTGTDARNPVTPTNGSLGIASDAVTLHAMLALSAADAGIAQLLQHGQAAAHVPEKSGLYKKIIVHLAKEGELMSSSSGISRGDYNGDGYADLAVGIPLEDVGDISACGGVVVIYGSVNGLVASATGVPAAQFWSQSSTGISGSNESGDRFGTALAAGEFNGDDFSDLAIGIPGEDLTVGGSTKANAGRAVIIYGSPAGLAASGTSVVQASQSFDLPSGNPEPFAYIDHIVPENAALGRALAWGDFDGDGIGDLAIGAPNLAIKYNAFLNPFPFLFPITEAGGVWVLYGSSSGLRLSRDQLFLADNNLYPVGEVDTTGWHYGASLTSGDFDGNDASDLAIGVPDENIYLNSSGRFIRRAGGVEVIPGFPASFGVTAGLGGNRVYLAQGSGLNHYTSASFRTEPLTDEHFGAALAAGDFDGDGADDLVIGVPGQAGQETPHPDGTYTLTNPGAGAVHVVSGVHEDTYRFDSPRTRFFYNTIGRDVEYFDQDVIFGSGNETGDRFGSALAVGKFDLGSALAIGVPREDLAGGIDAGQVVVIYTRAGGLSTVAPATAPQRIGDISAQAGAQFGYCLSAWEFGRSGVRPGLADLAVGVPFKDISGKADAGAMHVFYGTLSGLTFTGEQDWTQDSPGVPGGAETGDMFGAAGY